MTILIVWESKIEESLNLKRKRKEYTALGENHYKKRDNIEIDDVQMSKMKLHKALWK